MSIYKKLAEAKKEIGKISKDSTNPFFKSKYFDINSLLEHVEPILQRHGLLILQPIKEGSVMTLIQEVGTDESIYSALPLPELNDPQKLGSAITYYRRYTLQSLLALQASDDDGNIASGKVAMNTKQDKGWFNVNSKEWKAIEIGLKDGKLYTIDQFSDYKMRPETRTALTKLITG